MVSTKLALPAALAVLALATAISAKHLIKDPNQEIVMVSNFTRGLYLNCRINGTLEDVDLGDVEATTTTEDGEVKDLSKKEQVARQITWSVKTPEAADYTPIESKWVTTKEDGRSVLHVMDEEEAAKMVGKITCERGSQEQEWEVQPHFKLEKMLKSDTVVEGEDLKLFCKLRE